VLRSDDTQQIQAANLQGPQDELMNLMTIMYMCIQETLSDPFGLPSVRAELCKWDHRPFADVFDMLIS
jgi:hypothetical protein